jgi:hypothetical protein
MDGFLPAEARRLRHAVQKKTDRGTARRAFLPRWNIQRAFGALAGLAMAAVAVFFLVPGLWQDYTGTTVALRPDTQLEAIEVPLQSPIPSGPTNNANRIGSATVTPMSGALAESRPSPSTSPGASNPTASGALPLPVYPNALKISPSQSNESPNPAVLTPEVKAEIAEQVKLQLVADEGAAANPAPPDATGGDRVPGALDTARRMFIVSNVLNETTASGHECSLVPGDILTRIMDVPDANNKVTVLVTSSQKSDCAPGSMLVIFVGDLQEMQNDFRQEIEAGLQRIADNEGKEGMPAGPDARIRANLYGQADPDLTIEAELRQQQQEAGNVESEVAQATPGYIPSAFHRTPPADFENLSRATSDSQQSVPIRTAESGELTLVAWNQGSKQSNPQPQKNTSPPRPAPTPKSLPAGSRQTNKPVTSQPRSAYAKPASPILPSAGPATRGPMGGMQHRVPAFGRFIPPHGAAAMPDGRGGMSYKTLNGTQFHVGSSGRITSLATSSGAVAEFTSSGRIASIQNGRGMTIYRGPNGQQRIETARPDGARIVSMGRDKGFVERPFARGSQIFVRRTYMAGRYRYARVYGRYSYHGAYFYNYVPAHYFARAFYAWAYNPWPAALRWSWNWGAEPWYGYYGYYFAPYSYYAGAVNWLTDYLIATNLQAAYEAHAELTSIATPEQFAPRSDALLAAKHCLARLNLATPKAPASYCLDSFRDGLIAAQDSNRLIISLEHMKFVESLRSCI